MPLKSNQTPYQRLKEDLDYKNRAANAVHNYLDAVGTFNPAIGIPMKLMGTKDQTPAGIFASDVQNAVLNRVYAPIVRTLTGNDQAVVRKQSDITSLPDDQMNVLRAHYESLPDSRKKAGSWYGEDYRRVSGNYASGNRLTERMTIPEDMIANTLGQYNYYTDEHGNVIVTDTYDFSKDFTGAEGSYSTIRGLASSAASKETDPDAQKRHFKIVLGNPNYGWKVTK